MYSMMSGRQMFVPRMATPNAVSSKFNSQGMAVVGNMEPSALLQHRPHASYRPKQPSSYGSGAPYRSTGSLNRRGSPHHSPSLSASRPAPTTDPDHPVPLEESTPAAEVVTSDSTSVTTAADVEQPDGQQVANIKEKTPMCLINELARFNKVQHQYCLTDEQGPAHKKTFYVKLKLGDEEFSACGPSIKKAQHAAAGVGLEKTNYQHPPPKLRQPTVTAVSATKPGGGNSSVTPTVELNALAMKRGELAVYRPFERKPAPASSLYFTPPPQLDFRGGYFNQRYRYPKPAHRFYVALKVGEREFIGEGETMQAARHNAASMALRLLHTLPMPTREPPADTKALDDDANAEDSYTAKDASGNELLKSEISVVHEIALKRNYTVEFEIVKESGPPHMRTFVTRCKCGPLVTDAEGSSKKLSKKFSAEKMVVELRKLPALPPPPPTTKPKKNVTKPKQSKNLIKNVGSVSLVGVNPISRLIQIQQAKREKEPTFTLIAENGAPRCREFVVQVTVGESVCSGVGPNKKLAKRNAAEQMLTLLGYSVAPPPPARPALKPVAADDGLPPPDKRVTFVDHEPNVVPCAVPVVNGDKKPDIADVLNKGAAQVRALDQLKYLAKVLGFDVQATNFPKDNAKSEFLSMVTLCTNPPQFYNGSGASVDAAVDSAALAALRKFSEVGLDSAVSAGAVPGGVPGDVPGAVPGGQTSSAPVRSRARPERPIISTVVSVKKELK